MTWEDDRQEWFRERGRERKREFRIMLDGYKMGKGCVDCGYNAHPVALDFDHRDPKEKKYNVSQMVGRSDEALFDEMAKCDIRCANCHRVRTAREGHHGHNKRQRDGLFPE